MVKNRCCQSGDEVLKLTVSEEWADGKTDFLHVDTDSQKLKAHQNIFWVVMVKIGCGQSGHGTLTLTLSQKWTDGINCFFVCCTSSGKLKVDSVIFRGRGQKWPWCFNSWDPTFANEFTNWADLFNAHSDAIIFS